MASSAKRVLLAQQSSEESGVAEISSLPCTELPLVPKGILSAKQKVIKPRQDGKGEGGVMK